MIQLPLKKISILLVRDPKSTFYTINYWVYLIYPTFSAAWGYVVSKTRPLCPLYSFQASKVTFRSLHRAQNNAWMSTVSMRAIFTEFFKFCSSSIQFLFNFFNLDSAFLEIYEAVEKQFSPFLEILKLYQKSFKILF